MGGPHHIERGQRANNAVRDCREHKEGFQQARQARFYSQAKGHSYVHLIDGGMSDNLGMRPILSSLTSSKDDWSVLRLLNPSGRGHAESERRAARTRADPLTCAHGLSRLPFWHLSEETGPQQAPRQFDNRMQIAG